jgi:rod shape-determining protein MreD
MRRTIADIALSLLFLIVQTTVIRHIAIGTIVPDIVLVWIVYLGITRGHAHATIAGFLLGFLLDILSGPESMLGLSSLAKSVAGFATGYTFNANKTEQTLSGLTFVLILFGVSLVHNLLYFLIFLQGIDFSWNDVVLFHGLPTTIYTTAVGLVPLFVFARKYRV